MIDAGFDWRNTLGDNRNLGYASRKNIIRIVIGFSIVDTGIHLIIVASGTYKMHQHQ